MPKRYHFSPNYIKEKNPKDSTQLVSSLDYCNNLLTVLLKVILPEGESECVTTLLKSLQWFYVSLRGKAKVLTMAYRALHKCGSKSYLCLELTPLSTSPSPLQPHQLLPSSSFTTQSSTVRPFPLLTSHSSPDTLKVHSLSSLKSLLKSHVLRRFSYLKL